MRTAIARLSDQAGGKAFYRVNIQTVTCGYHFSIRPIYQKAWIEVKVHAFLFLMVVQDIVVIIFGVKPVIPPTYRK